MPKLILEVIIEDFEVTIKVLHQDEELRSVYVPIISYYSEDLTVKSSYMPELSIFGGERTLYIRGKSRSNDGDLCTALFKNKFERDAMLSELEKALAHINGEESRFYAKAEA